ncbi:MAG TPA: hypothetical protein VL443_30080 [Cyclobacteriaceae bacterium]|jgi:hypothetical protein|nr:hypothetical protein [Cyclobacteriaceae bacterium]
MKYFIEHAETRLWFYPQSVPKYVNTFNGVRIKCGSTFKEGWTNDPNRFGVQHNSKEEAEKWMKFYKIENAIITEHEFVFPSGGGN